MKFIKATIEGTTPLLCNRFTDAAQLRATAGTSSAIRTDSNPAHEDAAAKLYVDVDGLPCIPQPNLMRCIIDAGTFFKAGKSKVTTQKNSLLAACLDVKGVSMRIQHVAPWTVDSRPVRNPATGGRFLAHRPCFTDWKLDFEMEIDDSLIGLKLLREVVDAAGKRIGLGDFRPDRKGPFGKFVVVRWDVSNEAFAEAAE